MPSISKWEFSKAIRVYSPKRLNIKAPAAVGGLGGAEVGESVGDRRGLGSRCKLKNDLHFRKIIISHVVDCLNPLGLFFLNPTLRFHKSIFSYRK